MNTSCDKPTAFVEYVVFYVYASDARRKTPKQEAPAAYEVITNEEADENGDVFDRVRAPIAYCDDGKSLDGCWFCENAVVRRYVEARWPSGPARDDLDYEWGIE